MVRDKCSRSAKRVPTSIIGYSARRIHLDLGAPPVALRTSVLGTTGPAPTPPRSQRTGCSLLCFEEAVNLRCLTMAERASNACGRAPHPGDTFGVRCSRDRHVPPPRTLHGFGAILENCIASTSVLKEVAPCSFLPRRVEECAISSYKEPTVDALAPGADEGRGWLRKATGSCLPSFDPWISEWGNPAGVMPSHSCLNI